jgi:hypothetical protein
MCSEKYDLFLERKPKVEICLMMIFPKVVRKKDPLESLSIIPASDNLLTFL